MMAGLKLVGWRVRHMVVAAAVSLAVLAVCVLALLATLLAAPPLHRLRG